jgi:hypothetical protein
VIQGEGFACLAQPTNIPKHDKWKFSVIWSQSARNSVRGLIGYLMQFIDENFL